MVLKVQTGKVCLVAHPGLCARGSRDALAHVAGGLTPSTCGRRVQLSLSAHSTPISIVLTASSREAGLGHNGPSYYTGSLLTCGEISLGIVEAVRVGWPLKRVARWEVILHEAGWEAVEVVGVWRLVELWVLLVGWEGPTEVGGALHPEGRLTLGATPGRRLMLIVPWSFKLVIPIGVWLVVPGSISLPIPARVPSLLTPHALMAVVPGWAVGRSTLVVRVWGLFRGLQSKAQT